MRLQDIIFDLCTENNWRLIALEIMPDHVHMCLSIPPKYPVSGVVGFMKGKSAISIAREFMGKRRNYRGESFWARGYYVSTVGRDEDLVRDYIRH